MGIKFFKINVSFEIKFLREVISTSFSSSEFNNQILKLKTMIKLNSKEYIDTNIAAIKRLLPALNL